MAQMYGFKNGGEKPAAAFPMLPEGAYVAGIQNVKIDGKAPDQQIVLRVDIVEGEHTAYFTKRYNHDSAAGGKYEVRYKGDFRIQIPNDKNTKREHPEWDARTLNNSIWCIEQSNPGFHFDGDTDHIMELKGKLVGINMRRGTYNGVPYTKIGKLEVVDDVRSGAVKPMKPLPDRMGDYMDGQGVAVDAQSGFTQVETSELPF